MSTGFFAIPKAINEPVKSYAPGSPERTELQAMLKHLRAQQVDVPMYIGGKEIRTGKTATLNPPHDHKHVLGNYHKGDKTHVQQAIDAALAAKAQWSAAPWEQRASIFLKAADLLAGPYRAKLNAATMLGQSKNAYQAEIDAACELVDFLRFNVQYMGEIYSQQPISSPGIWNRLEQRPLEGFVLRFFRFLFLCLLCT